MVPPRAQSVPDISPVHECTREGRIVDLDQRLVNSIKAAAKESGVNLDEGRWQFMVADLTFTKTA